MIRTVPKKALLSALLLTAVLMMIYYSRKGTVGSNASSLSSPASHKRSHHLAPAPAPAPTPAQPMVYHPPPPRPPSSNRSTSSNPHHQSSSLTLAELRSSCPSASPPPRRAADIETVDVLPTLNFEADWIERREFWNDKMQRRYEKRRREAWSRVPLRAFVVPHSHNDPGWLKTFDGYFHTATRAILNNIVDKLTKYKEMTFIWTEISFLSLWYDTAHDARKANFQHLVEEGRFEILTGGWVMTDEANVDTFGMVDQLVEGHQWLRNHLNVTPKSSWSVDPFGHGGTFPYILKASGVDAMLIMRIHYAWKEWFAVEQQGDFLWRQQWDQREDKKNSILCHNFPYDIYSIKGSCGPHASTCLEFNYRRVQGDYNEYSARYTPVHAGNVKERAELLLEQYGKTGSLFPHNVVLVPLGDDFTYNHEVEFDQQYSNYKMLMDHINSNPEYNARVTFGTVTDYFDEVRARTSQFSTLNGDFFVYSDIFSEGRPAYWSGYFTTRPFMKQMSRRLSAHLRAAEILYTWSYQHSRQAGRTQVSDHFADLYGGLQSARRHLALFQHHDAITGTSKQAVMHDYALKLWDGLKSAKKVHRHAFQYLLGADKTARNPSQSATVFDAQDQPAYQVPPTPLALKLLHPGDRSSVLVFNPLAETVVEVVSVFVETTQVCVTDGEGNRLEHQINPTWNASGFFRLDVTFVEVSFVATLRPLSLNKFVVSRCSASEAAAAKGGEQTKVYCLRCPTNTDHSSAFTMSPKPDGAVQIENSELVLLFNEETHLLQGITHKRTSAAVDLDLEFSAYPTSQFRSGAYLFKTDSDGETDSNVAVFGPDDLKECVVISGPVFSELTLLFESGSQQQQEPGTFAHTVRLYHTTDGVRNKGVYIENDFDFGASDNHNDVDLFMRLRAGSIANGPDDDRPEFYTDMNGFQMQKRRIVRKINLEGNYYPITTMTYIEDESARLTLAVDHAQGATSWRRGWLEVMVDRRSTFDDARGMGEGVLDNRATKHRYWMLFEPRPKATKTAGKVHLGDEAEEPLSLPSQVASTLSRYLNSPSVQYTGNNADAFKSAAHLLSDRGTGGTGCGAGAGLAQGIHLLNLRTLSDPSDPAGPGKEALMVLHRQAADCALNPTAKCGEGTSSSSSVAFSELKVSSAKRTLLTGVKEKEEVSLADLEVEEPMALESVKVTF